MLWKIYYELTEELGKQKDPSRFAIVRVEQLYPFPEKGLREILGKYKKLKNLVWAQEEPMNNGAWSFVFFKLQTLLSKDFKGVTLNYAGRDERSSPAVGATYKHKSEQQKLLDEAFRGSI